MLANSLAIGDSHKVTWTKKDLKRSYACNMDLLLQLRERRGWTHAELAKEVGYSVRLLSKAESGKPISTLAIDSLAEAFSTPEETIYPEDLISDPVKLAKEFIYGHYVHQGNLISATRHFLEEELVCYISGDPKVFPFAGEHRGLDAVERTFKLFFSILEAPKNHDYEKCYQFLMDGNEVIVWGDSWLHPIGQPMEQPMRLCMRMKFRRGKLVSYDDRFDTLHAAKLIEDLGIGKIGQDITTDS